MRHHVLIGSLGSIISSGGKRDSRKGGDIDGNKQPGSGITQHFDGNLNHSECEAYAAGLIRIPILAKEILALGSYAGLLSKK